MTGAVEDVWLVNETEDEVTCQCDHLTSFSILLVRLHITICKQV